MAIFKTKFLISCFRIGTVVFTWHWINVYCHVLQVLLQLSPVCCNKTSTVHTSLLYYFVFVCRKHSCSYSYENNPLFFISLSLWWCAMVKVSCCFNVFIIKCNTSVWESLKQQRSNSVLKRQESAAPLRSWHLFSVTFRRFSIRRNVSRWYFG